MKIFLAQWHDRHTDDKFVAFCYFNQAKEQCHLWANSYNKDRYKFRIDNSMGFGDWCLYCGEGYYMAVHKIELVGK